MTRQLFTVSSGRSGTYLVHKLLSLYPQVESHHEFCCVTLQRQGVLTYLGFGGSISTLEECYGAGLRYSQSQLFADSSNKASWLINPIYTIYPQAKFLWLVRDGRKVTSSYYHKLPEESYTDKRTEAFYQWLDRRPNSLMYEAEWWRESLPPDKPYWWPAPRPDSPYAHAFRYEWGRFERLCWFWREVNTVIRNSLGNVPMNQWTAVRLEDLVSDRNVYTDLMGFIDLPPTAEGWQLLQRPVNVNEPVNYNLTPEQETFYWDLCGELHQELGYGKEGYDVRY